MIFAGSAFFGKKVSSDHRLGYKRLEIARCYLKSMEMLWPIDTTEAGIPPGFRGDMIESVALRCEVEEVSGRKLITFDSVGRQSLPNCHDALRVGEFEGAEKKRVDNAENISVGANAQSQSQHSNRGESRAFAQHPQAEANVFQKLFEPHHVPDFADLFLYAGDVAELSQSRVSRFLGSHAALDVLLCLALDVVANVLIEIFNQSFAAFHDGLLICGAKNAGDGSGESVPLAGFNGELPPALGGQPVKFGAAIIFGNAVLGGDPPSLDEAMKSRVERALLDLQNIGRIEFDCFGNRVSVRRPEEQRAENEQVESALQEFEALIAFFGRHSRGVYGASSRMSRGVEGER
jgi:hypothetical protein